MLNFKQLFESNHSKEVEKERDTILDKIHNNGIESLNKYEKEFLDSFKTGNTQEFYNNKHKLFSNEHFEFMMSSIEDYDGEEGGVRVRGEMKYKETNHILKGSIVETSDGQIISSFRVDEDNTDYDIVDPEDFGYYTDFLESIIHELNI